jgi:hypothetical protein
MSEEASSAPEEATNPPGAAAADPIDDGDGEPGGAGGRGCLPVLIGLFLLLLGAFIGTRIARHFPQADDPSAAGPTTDAVPLTSPSDPKLVQAITAADRPPVEMHYLVICRGAVQDGPRINLFGVVPELRPSGLPTKGVLTVALAISAANRDRKFAIRGFYADGTSFLEQELDLDPDDPRRPRPWQIPVEVELTAAEPLVFEVFTDDKILVGRRVVAVRVRPATGPTTQSTTEPATAEPTTGPAAEPGDEPGAEPGAGPDEQSSAERGTEPGQGTDPSPDQRAPAPEQPASEQPAPAAEKPTPAPQ